MSSQELSGPTRRKAMMILGIIGGVVAASLQIYPFFIVCSVMPTDGLNVYGWLIFWGSVLQIYAGISAIIIASANYKRYINMKGFRFLCLSLHGAGGLFFIIAAMVLSLFDWASLGFLSLSAGGCALICELFLYREDPLTNTPILPAFSPVPNPTLGPGLYPYPHSVGPPPVQPVPGNALPSGYGPIDGHVIPPGSPQCSGYAAPPEYPPMPGYEAPPAYVPPTGVPMGYPALPEGAAAAGIAPPNVTP